MPRKTARKSHTNQSSAGMHPKRSSALGRKARSRESASQASTEAPGSTAAAMRSSANVVRSSLSGRRSASSEASRIAGSTVQAVEGPLESVAKAVVGGTVGAVAGGIAGVSDAVRQMTSRRNTTRRG
jgi:hypothetical protein